MEVLPASAGMIPVASTSGNQSMCAPRIRGDDPGDDWGSEVVDLCSPHPRG